ncbi:hypothetical protein FISHEDRAFT_37411, partial [Fistulina hepatica ATCC 64428]
KQAADRRTRRDRVQNQIKSWRRQLPALKRTYLAWKAHGPPAGSEETSWSVTVHSFRGIREETFRAVEGSHSLNETMAYNGVIGATPESPQVAFTFHFLESYRQLHRTCPRLSIEAMARAIQNLHAVPRKAYLARQLSSAYDIYLEILCSVDSDIKSRLHRSDPKVQAWLLCAPCMYRLQDDIELRPSMLMACDGNNSLKLIDSHFRVGETRKDDRKLRGFHFLEPDDVDRFKDDVARGQAMHQKKSLASAAATATVANHPNDDVAWLNAEELDENMKVQMDACVERWKAAGPEAKKKMVELFAVSGIFIAVCRHGHVLVMCDMIRSGELYVQRDSF